VYKVLRVHDVSVCSSRNVVLFRGACSVKELVRGQQGTRTVLRKRNGKEYCLWDYVTYLSSWHLPAGWISTAITFSSFLHPRDTLSPGVPKNFPYHRFGTTNSIHVLLLSSVMPCQATSMVVVHVASGTRDILVFWAAWPRPWATPYIIPNSPLHNRFSF
jgi:hypothetical protein